MASNGHPWLQLAPPFEPTLVSSSWDGRVAKRTSARDQEASDVDWVDRAASDLYLLVTARGCGLQKHTQSYTKKKVSTAHKKERRTCVVVVNCIICKYTELKPLWIWSCFIRLHARWRERVFGCRCSLTFDGQWAHPFVHKITFKRALFFLFNLYYTCINFTVNLCFSSAQVSLRFCKTLAKQNTCRAFSITIF